MPVPTLAGYPIRSPEAFGTIGDAFVAEVHRFTEANRLPVRQFDRDEKNEEIARPPNEAAALITARLVRAAAQPVQQSGVQFSLIGVPGGPARGRGRAQGVAGVAVQMGGALLDAGQCTAGDPAGPGPARG